MSSDPTHINIVGFNIKTKIGNNGFFSFKDSENYFYYSHLTGLETRVGGVSGLKLNGAINQFWTGAGWKEYPQFTSLRTQSYAPDPSRLKFLYVDPETGLVYKND